MLNECIFSLHIGISVLFLIVAIRLGKSALITYISGLWLFANFFVTKQIELFGMTVTASDAYTISAMYGMSVLQERYGKPEALKCVITSFLLLIASTFFSYIHLIFIPSPNDITHTAFVTVLNETPRLMLASIMTFLITSVLDLRLFQWLQKKTSLSFTVRSTSTVILITFCDTALFTVFGLYGIISSPFHVFLVSLIIKYITISLTAPFMSLLQYICPQKNRTLHL